jgi:hypothetical protein
MGILQKVKSFLWEEVVLPENTKIIIKPTEAFIHKYQTCNINLYADVPAQHVNYYLSLEGRSDFILRGESFLNRGSIVDLILFMLYASTEYDGKLFDDGRYDLLVEGREYHLPTLKGVF